MAIGDFFSNLTGGSYEDAATKQRQYLGDLTSKIGGQVQGAIGSGTGAIQAGTTAGVNAITSGVGTGRSDIASATPQALASLYSGQNLGAGALTGAVDPALAALYGGAGAYDPLYQAAQGYGQAGEQASSAQADALGLNGPEGVARAQASFQAGPGYQFQLGQGVDAITRAQNAAGMVASGNTTRAAQTFGQGLAKQEWDKYLANLQQRQQLYSPLQAEALARYGAAGLGTGQTAAGIFSGVGGSLADLYSKTGLAGAGIQTGAGKSLADLAQTGGLAAGNLYATGGAQQANLISGLTGQQLGAEQKLGEDYASTYGAEAAAKQAGAAQLASGALQLGTLAAGGGFLPSIGSGGLSGGLQFGSPYGPAAPKTNTIFNLSPYATAGGAGGNVG